MSHLVPPETADAGTDPATYLDEAAGRLRLAALQAPLTTAERSYLASTATRLDAMAERLRAEPDEPDEPVVPVRRPERYYTRSEAARALKVAPNTLLNWETRGLLVPKRDARGWRVYGREDLARALALASHVPVSDLAGHDRG